MIAEKAYDGSFVAELDEKLSKLTVGSHKSSCCSASTSPSDSDYSPCSFDSRRTGSYATASDEAKRTAVQYHPSPGDSPLSVEDEDAVHDMTKPCLGKWSDVAQASAATFSNGWRLSLKPRDEIAEDHLIKSILDSWQDDRSGRQPGCTVDALDFKEDTSKILLLNGAWMHLYEWSGQAKEDRVLDDGMREFWETELPLRPLPHTDLFFACRRRNGDYTFRASFVRDPQSTSTGMDSYYWRVQRFLPSATAGFSDGEEQSGFDGFRTAAEEWAGFWSAECQAAAEGQGREDEAGEVERSAVE